LVRIESILVQTWLECCLQQMSLYLLIIGSFHACRKREMKSGYQRWYRVNRSRNCFFQWVAS